MKAKNNLNDNVFSYRNRLVRFCWKIIYLILFRYSPISLFKWRVILLKLFGADVCFTSRFYPSCQIWLPSNLAVAQGSTIGPNVKIYNQGYIRIGNNTIISQYAYVCAGTHDYNDPIHPLIISPIEIGDNVWLCAQSFVGPGVAVADGTVVGACGVLVKSTRPWSVYAGNPAVKVNERNRFC